MMLVAVGVRIRIKDTLPQTLPALIYLALNAYLSLCGILISPPATEAQWRHTSEHRDGGRTFFIGSFTLRCITNARASAIPCQSRPG